MEWTKTGKDNWRSEDGRFVIDRLKSGYRLEDRVLGLKYKYETLTGAKRVAAMAWRGISGMSGKTSKKKNTTTEVIFRVWRYKPRTVIAMFPYIPAGQAWQTDYVMSYEHHGQHGGANYSHLMSKATKAATPAEYKDLKKELEDIGYKLKVIKTRNRNKAEKEFRKYFKSIDKGMGGLSGKKKSTTETQRTRRKKTRTSMYEVMIKQDGKILGQIPTTEGDIDQKARALADKLEKEGKLKPGRFEYHLLLHGRKAGFRPGWSEKGMGGLSAGKTKAAKEKYLVYYVHYNGQTGFIEIPNKKVVPELIARAKRNLKSMGRKPEMTWKVISGTISTALVESRKLGKKMESKTSNKGMDGLGIPPTKSFRGKGGVRIETFKGKDYFQVKYYPAKLDKGGKGKKALYKVFDKNSFRWTKRGKYRTLVACPKGKYSKGKCSVGLVALQTVYPTKELAAYKKMAESGKLGFDNRHQVERIKELMKPKRAATKRKTSKRKVAGI